MLININLKDQIKSLYLGVLNISLNFKIHAEEIKNYKSYKTLSHDWSMVAQDINKAMRYYQEKTDEDKKHPRT